MIARLRCLLGRHDTRIVTEGDEGRIVCRDCGAVLDRWRVLQPGPAGKALVEHERLARERRAQAIRDERERRAAQMNGRAGRVVRMR